MTIEALEVERLRAELSEMRVQRARERARDGWAEVERLRGVLARIEAMVWYEPQDDDDTVESVRAMVRERDEARAEAQAWQSEELSRRTERDAARAEVSRRDREHDALVETAQKALAIVAAERDELRHKLAGEASHIRSLEDLLVEATRERDDAQAEVERLRAALAQAQRADE